MLKKIFAKRRVRKSLTFSCVFVLTIVITAVSTSANSYDIAGAMSEGFLGEPLIQAFSLSENSGDEDSESSDDTWDNGDEQDDYSETEDNSDNWSGWHDDSYIDESAYSSNDDYDDTTDDTQADTPSERKSAKKSKDNFEYNSNIPMSKELQRYTYEQCVANGLDYELVLALIWRESRFKTDAVNYNSNGTTDTGIMQINDVNKKWISKELGITDLWDPVNNIRAGTVLLGRLTKKHGEHNALMAYQYGEAGMERKLSQGVTTNKQIQVLYSMRDYYQSLTKTPA